MPVPSQLINVGGISIPNPEWINWFTKAPDTYTPFGTIVGGGQGGYFIVNDYGAIANKMFGSGSAQQFGMQYLDWKESAPTLPNPSDVAQDIEDIGRGIKTTTDNASLIAQLGLIALAYVAFSSAGGVKGIKKGLGI